MPAVSDEYVLCAYVDGSDLHNVAPLLRTRFQQFVADHKWITPHVHFIALIDVLDALHLESGRAFALILAYPSRPWLQNHLWFIDGKAVVMTWLRDAIARLSPAMPRRHEI
jgi:hypothetical protein